MHGEQGDEQRDGPDETVSGELLPRMEADELAALRMGLQDIAHDLTGERRALALELRQLFLVLDMSVRRYAVLRHYSPSSVSRYLSGHTVAPDHFVVTLVEDVGRDKGRPLAVEARERIMSIQRAALRTSSPRAWKLQDLEDRLVAAHQEARVARTQADAVAAQLYTERQRVAGIEEERQQLADSLARHQASSGAELEVLRSEQQRIRGERDELRSRVAALEEALAAAEHRVAQAEQRCNELEGDLLAADAVEAAEAAERRGKEQAELSRLRTEVERLRQAAEPTAATAETWPEHPSRQIPEHEPGSGSGQQTLVISFAGLNRSWAAWIAAQLERRGLRVVLLRWEPAEQTPLLDLLRDLRSAEGRILLVISERYFQLETRTHEEWNGALREVVSADPHRFAAVSVSATWVPTAIAMLAPIDLTGLAEDESERRLVAGLGMPADTQHVSEQERRRGPRFPAALPEVWSGVPRRNPRFTGREMLLNLAYQMLQDAEPGAGVLTLHGMPGVGTTQLAAEYVYRFGSDYDVVWWVNSEHSTIHRQHLAELAPKLGLATGPEYGERLRAVLGSLRRGDPFARWLLVMDGADDPGQVVGMLPTGPGHVLITSRNLEWAEHRSAMLEVPAYDRHESIAFIRRRAPRLSEGDADRLADALEDLPLLIDQTAGWLDGSALSVEDYLTLLDDRPDIDAVEVSADFPVTFQTAWVDLLNKLRENAPATVDLLRLCTFFAPGPIPVRILRQMPSSELPLQLAGLIDDPLQWNRAVKQLLQYSVIRLGPSKTGDPAGIGTDTLYLHRMVHQLVNKDMPDEDRSTLLDVARRALVAADPGQPEEPRLWSQYEAVVPHLTYADVPHSEEPAVQRLLLNCLHYLSCAGHDADGAALGNQALEAWESLLDEDHSNAAELVHHYTGHLRSIGRYADSESLDRPASAHMRRQHGDRGPAYLRAAGDLVADLRGLGHYDQALESARQLAATHREVFGEDDPHTLEAMHNLGCSLRAMSRYAEALDVDRRTVEGRRRQYGNRSTSTLVSETAYAIDLRLAGDYAQAESVQVINERACKHLLGPCHPQTLRAQHNLAASSSHSGDRDRYLREVVKRSRRQMGEAHPHTLAYASTHSCHAREYGDIDQARETNESILSHYEAMFPHGHPHLTGTRANQALILRSVGERDAAHEMIERALADMSDAVGARHAWTLACAINAAALRNLIGDVEAAAELSTVTVSLSAQALGPTHPLTLAARVGHASDLRGMREYDEAARVEEEALNALAMTQGDHHPDTLAAHARTRPYWNFEPDTF